LQSKARASQNAGYLGVRLTLRAEDIGGDVTFTGICLITENVPRLVEFYRNILDTSFSGNDLHSESKVGGAYFAIYSRAASNEQMQFGLGSVHGTGNVTLMFKVDDVDLEYERIRPLLSDTIAEPKTYPWGARAFHFFDPDGNIVDFVCPP